MLSQKCIAVFSEFAKSASQIVKTESQYAKWNALIRGLNIKLNLHSRKFSEYTLKGTGMKIVVKYSKLTMYLLLILLRRRREKKEKSKKRKMCGFVKFSDFSYNT